MPKTAAKRTRKLPVPWPILALLVAVLLSAGYSVLATHEAGASEHPTPRAGITGANVLPPEQFRDDPRVMEVYAEAAKIAPVLDGIYCHCDCHDHMGHVSLLTCFESDHGSGCGTCLGEAHLAYEMSRKGATLDQIRTAVDQQFGHA
ncbi:MAG: hypothetical protein JWM27_200 [Gemmatimonadetes bacterium]|nr:hypothetical protein [Gemmatimonadota bacterium]